MKFLAVDLGASSGRTILGQIDDQGRIEMVELTRFSNPIIRMGGHFFWDILYLYAEIIKALREVARRKITIHSIGIDTWGVDFTLWGKDGSLLGNPYCYRDTHTENAPERLFRHLSREKLYKKTGIQIMNFNSLFQFEALRYNQSVALEVADKILFIPDALSYMLTGEQVTEYTIASTSQMMNPHTRRFDPELLASVGLREEQFGRLVFPGEVIGVLSREVRELTGLGAIPVVAVAGHDTASAVAAVPARGKHFAYLSSGTWSLMGVELEEAIVSEKSFTRNFTNEGGIEGTIRFLKNICGFWLLERCREEWTSPLAYDRLVAEAVGQPAFRHLINPDASCFANPRSMSEAIRTYCRLTGQDEPDSEAAFARCIFDSLALRYRQVFGYMQELTPFAIDHLHIIGGGSRNQLLNQFTCDSIQLPVTAGSAESTALGNILLQAKACGRGHDHQSMRDMVIRSVELRHYEPKEVDRWDEAYDKYERLCQAV